MIYVIDHRDSFTYNLVNLLSFFDKVFVSDYLNIDRYKLKNSSLVVFSPGPGQPKNYPESTEIYRLIKGKNKILGVCLGFQLILYSEKAKIIQQKQIYHGYQSKIKVLRNSNLFQNKYLVVGRYHSLKLKEPFFSKNIQITMRCNKSDVAMAFEDQKNKIYGFQFHPDSFLTQNGKYIIQKIISA